jgi:hypothetical protein
MERSFVIDEAQDLVLVDNEVRPDFIRSGCAKVSLSESS